MREEAPLGKQKKVTAKFGKIVLGGTIAWIAQKHRGRNVTQGRRAKATGRLFTSLAQEPQKNEGIVGRCG
ncbi:hypothetical protein AA0472_2555 [Acetobacter estunensis NRIC 0472]|nr:hypothetical protein AA0472_2555 [Acetobacter estunensis NRIC 0472]